MVISHVKKLVVHLIFLIFLKGDHVLLPLWQDGNVIRKLFEVDEVSHQFQQGRCIISETVYTVKPICQQKKK
jgi:hypothetical protein